MTTSGSDTSISRLNYRKLLALCGARSCVARSVYDRGAGKSCLFNRLCGFLTLCSYKSRIHDHIYCRQSALGQAQVPDSTDSLWCNPSSRQEPKALYLECLCSSVSPAFCNGSPISALTSVGAMVPLSSNDLSVTGRVWLRCALLGHVLSLLGYEPGNCVCNRPRHQR